MAKQPNKTKPEQIRQALARTFTVSGLEELAGINTTASSERISFWNAFLHMPGADGLDAGCRELRRLIEIRAYEAEAAVSLQEEK